MKIDGTFETVDDIRIHHARCSKVDFYRKGEPTCTGNEPHDRFVIRIANDDSRDDLPIFMTADDTTAMVAAIFDAIDNPDRLKTVGEDLVRRAGELAKANVRDDEGGG